MSELELSVDAATGQEPQDQLKSNTYTVQLRDLCPALQTNLVISIKAYEQALNRESKFEK
ncbi:MULTISPECIES: hypothetical protein [Pseudomonas]|uniref:hypothetical protein n=1 Tax=Pseudomonas TaxID=286 RepID=UPI00257FC580|nr:MULTISPECIES: hypothetical protein [Pseudomonas]